MDLPLLCCERWQGQCLGCNRECGSACKDCREDSPCFILSSRIFLLHQFLRLFFFPFVIPLCEACLREEAVLLSSSSHFHCADRETLNAAQVPSTVLSLNCLSGISHRSQQNVPAVEVSAGRWRLCDLSPAPWQNSGARRPPGRLWYTWL